MSDSGVYFIPYDETAQPSVEGATRGIEFLKACFAAEWIGAAFKGGVTYFSGHQNWSTATCPRCAADIHAWMFESIGLAYERSRFNDLAATTPCCALETSLNRLNFGQWGAGFARFALEVRNYEYPAFDADQHSQLEAALGLSLRAIWYRI